MADRNDRPEREMVELSNEELDQVLGGASGYLLQIEGIGRNADDKHKDEIQVLSWSWGETQM